jgi:para-aminobenzoate synthetase component 1
LSAAELIGALLALDSSRRLHLLDSGGARGADARLLVAGFDPFEYVEAFGEELRMTERGARAAHVRRGSALALLDRRLGAFNARSSNGHASRDSRASHKSRACPHADGACFVTLSYELARRFERLRVAPRETAEGPDAVYAFCDVVVVHDYARGTTFVSGAGARRLRETAEELLDAAEDWKKRTRHRHEPDGGEAAPARQATFARETVGASSRFARFEELDSIAGALASSAASDFTRAEYERAVERVREHIRAGDIYQANLTQRITCPPRPNVTPEQVFLRLRREHPAAFAAFLRQDGRTIVSASPERFLRVRAREPKDQGWRTIEAWPIKGTRPRGASPEEDARLRAALLSSEKDRAENVMIVDLMRNDLGRVCRYGSVEVTELCSLQEHPTLFHLVSKVRGRLRDSVTAGDLLRATFPCGSITGAPKLRAMEILDGLERAARGVSMGSIGYFTRDGAADLNVAIRTITFEADGAAHFRVGGGIVADSSPADEYEETLVKARALLRALGIGAP